MKRPEIEIRQATPEDCPSLYGMLEQAGAAKDENYFETCLKEQEKGRRQIFIIALKGREGRQDCGYAMLNRRPQYALYRRLDIPEIQGLNIIPAARRQGLASLLIAHCEDVVRQAGGAHIGISVGLYKDFGPAQRLYAKLGYLPDGNGVTYERQAVTAGEIRPVDDHLCLMMVKDL